MVKTINVGIIGGNLTEEFFKTSEANKVETFYWKKIYLEERITPYFSKKHPKVEFVKKAESIINDRNIDLVFVSAKYLEFVKPVIQSGKSVRII